MQRRKYTKKREQWRKVPGFPGYFVSNIGRVKSTRRRKILILQQFKTGRYLCVNLRTEQNKPFQMRVHSIVLTAFRGERPDGKEASHLNGRHEDNRIRNLRFETPKQNNRRKLDHGTIARGEALSRSSLTESDVRAIRYADPNCYDARFFADLHDVSLSCIYSIIKRRTWTHI